jgi:acyl carrier protein
MTNVSSADADTRDAESVRGLILDLLVAEGHTGVTMQTALTDGGLNLSSLELVRLLVGLEERLGIELDDATIMNARFDTVDDLIALVIQST